MERPDELAREDDSDAWAELAEHRDALEMTIEEETPFAEYARQLLNRLDEEGY